MGKRIAITLVRHGETTHNVRRLLQGQSNIPLSEVGIQQAERLGKKLAIASETFTKAYSSDLARAYRTAELITQHSGNGHLDIQKDLLLRERSFGPHEGKPSSILMEGAKKNNVNVRDYTIEGAEFPSEVMHRAASFFETICEDAEMDGNEENILVVTHGGWIQYFLMHLHKDGSNRYVLENFDPRAAIMIHKNTAVSKFTVEKKNAKNGKEKVAIRFEKVNDAEHLNE